MSSDSTLLGLRCLLAVILATMVLPGCEDVRDFEGSWGGPPVSTTTALLTGFSAGDQAVLTLERVQLETLQGVFSTSAGLFQSAPIAPLPSAQGDALDDLSFSGSPLRVFLSFTAPTDGGGDALVLTALYPEERIELRVLRGQPQPLYAIFDLRRQ